MYTSVTLCLRVHLFILCKVCKWCILLLSLDVMLSPLSPLSQMPQESSSKDANKSEKLSSHSFPETAFFQVNKNIEKTSCLLIFGRQGDRRSSALSVWSWPFETFENGCGMTQEYYVNGETPWSPWDFGVHWILRQTQMPPHRQPSIYLSTTLHYKRDLWHLKAWLSWLPGIWMKSDKYL